MILYHVSKVLPKLYDIPKLHLDYMGNAEIPAKLGTLLH